MPHRTKEFMENNLCGIHNTIHRLLQETKDLIRVGSSDEAMAVLAKVQSLVDVAITKGIKMEDRLKVYRFTIRALGFVREKEHERLSFKEGELILNESIRMAKERSQQP